jgi:hypothetical protein
MRKLLKKSLPYSMITFLQRVISQLKKPLELVLMKIQPHRHEKALKKVRSKNKATVAFFVLNADIWKFEEVLTMLENDPRFEPVIVVCPPINLRDEDIYSKMEKAYEFFKQNKHNVIYSYNKEKSTYLNVKKEISPDIVFFTNPYGYTLKEYRIENFLDVLTCYAQYSFILEESEHFYNKTFHNLLWKAFYETKSHKKLAKRYAANEGANVEVTGYPGIDSFVYGKRLENGAWKNRDISLKRIIWAPHWSVIERGHGRPPASNFLEISEFMLHVTETYHDKIQIAFKPHPYLKHTLYHHPDWGKERAESYYDRWDKIENGQLETGNYVDLVNSSDAMILDSISFIAEYLYSGKPSLFIKATPDVSARFNNFGKMALDHHYHGSKSEDITQFIENVVIEGKDTLQGKRDQFYRDVLTPPNGKSASKNIYNILCKELFD